jgi:hypothetical protein
MMSASVGDSVPVKLPTDQVSFDQLGVAPAQAEVFGRADLEVAIDTRRLPAGTQAQRLLLDTMVAPDGTGEKAVVTAYVNERMLASTVAAVNEPTRLDLALPQGLVGTSLNIRAVIQRRGATGDCRFEPQGYPAQILTSSAVVLTPANPRVNDFSDLATHWANHLEVMLPNATAEQPVAMLNMVADVLDALAPDLAPISVTLLHAGEAPIPSGPFLAVSDMAPAGSDPRVRFDRGMVAVEDRSGHPILDLGGIVSGAVAQIATADNQPGLWIKPLANDGSLPAADDLRLDHGDVAFLDHTGVALSMSTERDTLIKVSYPEQVSWITIGERFRSWIVGGLWVFATIIFLFVLQRMFRRRPASPNE